MIAAAIIKRIHDIRTVERLWEGRLYDDGKKYICLLYNANGLFWVKDSEMTSEMGTKTLYHGDIFEEASKIYESIK